MTVHKFSELKLTPYVQVADGDDTHTWQGRVGNDVSLIQWQKLHDNPETWGCSFVRNPYHSVSATVKYRRMPDYAPVSKLEKKKRETWVWLASVSVTDDKESQTLEDGYYFFNLSKAQDYCEIAALMICNSLKIVYPDGANILRDKIGCPIIRYSRVILTTGREVVVSDFGWHEFYVPSTELEFRHSPQGYMQVCPTVKYLDANQDWQSIPCNEVKVNIPVYPVIAIEAKIRT